MPIDLRRLLFPLRHVSGARGRRPCEYPGCTSVTEEQKPYCVRHLEHNPYASEVLAKIHERVADDEEARRGGHQSANLEAATAVEIVLHLQLRGEVTFRRVCRDLCLDKETAWAYVTKLHIFARISRTRSGKGVWKLSVRESYLLELEEPRYAEPVGPFRMVSE